MSNPVRRKTVTRSKPSASLATPVFQAPPAVLRAFQALAPSDLYQLASKEIVTRGFDYYRRERLLGYAWTPDGSKLTAEVEGTRRYTVTFFVEDDALFADCNCPAWEPDWSCKHVLCACFTTINLLSPENFRLPGANEARLASLRAELLARVPSEVRRSAPAGRRAGLKADIEIVMDATRHPPSLFLRLDGMKLEGTRGWAPSGQIPLELIPLLHSSPLVFAYGEDALLQYLRLSGGPHPIILETPEKTVPLKWDPAVKVFAKTQFELVGDRVTVRAACLVDGVELERFVRFRSFVADPDTGRLVRLRDERGWNAWLAFQRGVLHHAPFLSPRASPGEDRRLVLLPDQSGAWPRHSRSEELAATLPLQEFQACQIDVIRQHADRVLRDLILAVDGRVQALPPAEPQLEAERPLWQLVLVPPAASDDPRTACYRLRVECRWGALAATPSVSVFGFFPWLEQSPTLSGPLRAWKRKRLLYKAFFALLSVTDPVERDQRIRNEVSGVEFRSSRVRNEGQRLLRQALAAAAREDLRLCLHAGRWTVRPVDKAREADLYRIPFDVFGPEIFRGMDRCDEMRVPSPLLFERLPELAVKLAEAGIPLLYEEKPVHAARWDCAVHVGRGAREGTGIDWFEIRPEIRCDGAVLEEETWREAVRRGGLVATGGVLQVLDAATLERLRALLSLTDQAEAARTASRLVAVPRLGLFDWLALREQGLRVSLPPAEEAVLARLLGFERIETPPLPRGVRSALRPYQKTGYAWLAFLYRHRFGACLADDMGLGKTLQAICLLAAVNEGIVPWQDGARGPHLVVVPTSLLFNWEQELARFCPALTVRPYTGKERALAAGDGEIVLTTYGLLRRDAEALARTRFHVIVFDEAQAVKNLHAATTGAARRLTGCFKLAVTGTPLENHLGEYFSIIDLCLPGLLGDYDRFRAELRDAESGALDRLLRRTRPFVLRRTKEQTLRDLPAKIERNIYLDLTDRQKVLYQQTVEQVRTTIDEAYRSKPQAQAQLIALTAILKLRQLCLSPRLLTGRREESAPKLEFLMERLQVLLEEEHSALVFSQFTSFLDLVQEACDGRGIPYSRLDGSTAAGKRKALVTAFQARKAPGVFLLSLKAGGQGLNLTRATYVFHLDPWWNPAVEQQASDRAHRIGQKRVVTITRILMRHTIEEKMMELKQRKLDLYQTVVGAAVRGAGRAALTKADFDFLLSPAVDSTRTSC
ncbi:DEAD/DEAH box helicase [Nitrospira sp. Kam-Ns4a]